MQPFTCNSAFKRTDLVKKIHDVHITNVVQKSSAKLKITKMFVTE